MKGLNKWHESADGEHSWYYSQRGSEDVVCDRCCELFEPKNNNDEPCDDCADYRYCKSCHRWGHKKNFRTTWELGVKVKKCIECLFDLEV